MASITAAGSGSGIDIEGLVTKLMAAESTPLSALAKKETKLQTKISAIGQFKSLISSLQGTLSPLLNKSSVNGISATSSNASAVAISAGNAADLGAHTLDVLSLAKGQRLTSASGAFTSSTQNLAAVGAGTAASAQITINFGTWTETTSGDPAVTSRSFAESSASAVTVDIEAGSDGKITLAEVRDAINSKNVGINASIVTDKEGSARLVLSSSNTGAEKGFSLDVALTDASDVELYNSANGNTAATTDFSGMVFNQTTANASAKMDLSQLARDAHIQLDGVDVYRASNTITDLLEDVTLTLKATTLGPDGVTSTAANLTISRSSSGIATQLEAFVKAYNALASTIKSSTSYDATTKTAGTLLGDATVNGLQTQLRALIGGRYGDSGDTITTLNQLGVTFQKNGTLALDTSKLSDAVSNDLDGVVKFLGSFDQSSSTITPTSSYKSFGYMASKALGAMIADDGLIATKLKGLNKSVDLLEDRYDTLETRLATLEKRYRAKFTAMDTSIASMQSTSSYLTNLLNSMSSSS